VTTVLDPERTDDELHDAITAGQRRLCEAHAALLVDVGEHDRVEAWRRMGAKSEEDYLVRYHQFHWGTARDYVRQARVLARHPEIACAYAAGEMSADKLNAACRLAAARDAEADKALGPFDDGTPPGGPDASPEPSPGAGDEPSPGAGDQPSPADEPSPRDEHSPGDEPSPDGSPGASGDSAGPDQPSSGASGDPSPGPVDPAAAAAELLDLIDSMSTKQLDELARRVQQATAAEAHARWGRRHLMVIRDAVEGKLLIKHGELFADDAALVWAALSDYVSNCKPDPETGLYPSMKERYADALVAMAKAYLEVREKAAHRPLVFFHFDARLLVGEDGWAETSDYSPLAAETARRLACDCKVGAVAEDGTGNPLNLGRRSREASWLQVEFLRRRDGGCRLCGSQLFLQAHHIRYWDRDQGPTDMSNLCMACQTCHHLCHEGGWTIEGDANGELRFITPGGTVIRRAPRARPPGRAPTKRRPTAGTTPPSASASPPERPPPGRTPPAPSGGRRAAPPTGRRAAPPTTSSTPPRPTGRTATTATTSSTPPRPPGSRGASEPPPAAPPAPPGTSPKPPSRKHAARAPQAPRLDLAG
jgi:hypothetical protein